MKKKVSYFQKNKKIYKKTTSLFGTDVSLYGEVNNNGKFKKINTPLEDIKTLFPSFKLLSQKSSYKSNALSSNKKRVTIAKIGNSYEEKIVYYTSAIEKEKRTNQILKYGCLACSIITFILFIIAIAGGMNIVKTSYVALYTADSGGSVIVQSDEHYYSKYEQKIEEGKYSTTVTAVPQIGWYFVNWSDGKTSTSRSDLIKGDFSVTANFKCYFKSGFGTASKPFRISTVTEFKKMIELVNSSEGYYANAYYSLCNSLDFNAEQLMPLGNKYIFTGVFEGNNYTLTNLKLGTFKLDDAEITALFPYVCNATIKNLKLSNICANRNATCSGNYFYGTMVGVCENSKVYNCSVENVTVFLTSQYGNNKSIIAGGLIARSVGSVNIYNCSAETSFTVSAVYDIDSCIKVGGVAGDHKFNTTHYSWYVSNISSSGKIIAEAGKDVYIGGVYGCCEDSQSRTDYNCSSTCVLEVSAGTIHKGDLWGSEL